MTNSLQQYSRTIGAISSILDKLLNECGELLAFYKLCAVIIRVCGINENVQFYPGTSSVSVRMCSISEEHQEQW